MATGSTPQVRGTARAAGDRRDLELEDYAGIPSEKRNEGLITVRLECAAHTEKAVLGDPFVTTGLPDP